MINVNKLDATMTYLGTGHLKLVSNLPKVQPDVSPPLLLSFLTSMVAYPLSLVMLGRVVTPLEMP